MERVLFFVSLTLFGSTQGLACSNYRRASACSIHPAASLIFLGTVINSTEPIRQENGQALSTVRFHVDEAFKGTQLGATVDVQAIGGANCCGALPSFAQGSQFLLFTGFLGAKQAVIAPCDPVIPLAEAGDHLLSAVRMESSGATCHRESTTLALTCPRTWSAVAFWASRWNRNHARRFLSY
jgi:hypothetical protein